jgi:hypothetical protein
MPDGNDKYRAGGNQTPYYATAAVTTTSIK